MFNLNAFLAFFSDSFSCSCFSSRLFSFVCYLLVLLFSCSCSFCWSWFSSGSFLDFIQVLLSVLVLFLVIIIVPFLLLFLLSLCLACFLELLFFSYWFSSSYSLLSWCSCSTIIIVLPLVLVLPLSCCSCSAISIVLPLVRFDVLYVFLVFFFFVFLLFMSLSLFSFCSCSISCSFILCTLCFHLVVPLLRVLVRLVVVFFLFTRVLILALIVPLFRIISFCLFSLSCIWKAYMPCRDLKRATAIHLFADCITVRSITVPNVVS